VPVPVHKARILLAEDEQRHAAPIVERLTKVGHAVRWVKAMRDVRAAMTEVKPDVLLLDVTMDTDGLEFFQAIRFAPEHPPAGVIVLTESGDTATRERAQQLGAAAVLMKPIDGDALVETLDDLLSFV
jgi:DNA-binding response OmpR family regulator